MTKLSVNLNAVAYLRNRRSVGWPSVTGIARAVLEAGADGVTVHPRPDERHIRGYDVDAVAKLLKEYPNAEYNIEGNPFHGLIEHCRAVEPAQATLVPDATDAFTSNSGWALDRMGDGDREALREAIEDLHSIGCRVSLFMDPLPELMPLAKDLGADRIELYTEPFASAFAAGKGVTETPRYAAAATAAKELGLEINAGHDLSLENLDAFLSAVHGVAEVSIGHALIADALQFGMAATVKRYLAICRSEK